MVQNLKKIINASVLSLLTYYNEQKYINYISNDTRNIINTTIYLLHFLLTDVT